MPQAIDPVTQYHINQAADRLAYEFAGIFSQETIARYMADSTDLLGEARINVFVPVLHVRSAGSAPPGDEINPNAVAALLLPEH